MNNLTATVNLSTNASLRGKVLFARNNTKPVFSFFGIPYAQSPIGELRFKPPKSAILWKGERLATEFGIIKLNSSRTNYCLLIVILHVMKKAVYGMKCEYLNLYFRGMF